jgi:hypothetical protein
MTFRKNSRRILMTALTVLAFTALTIADAKVDSTTIAKAAAESLSAAATGEHGITPQIAGKLSGEQIVKAMKDLQDFRLHQKELENKGNPAVSGTIVPIVAVGSFFTTITLVVLIPVFLQFRRNRLMHETMRNMVEKGMEIPTALLVPPEKPKSDLRRGIIGVSSGIGIILFFLALNGFGDKNPWAIGLIPLAIGIGYIVVWKLENKKVGTKDLES